MQDPEDRLAGDNRLRTLTSGWVAKVIAIGCSVTVICTISVLQTAFRLTPETGPVALSNDFRVFWAAATLAVEGDFLAVFDTPRLTAIHNVEPEDWMPWLYPPGFLLLLTPFGTMPFAPAFLILTLLSGLSIALAIRPFTSGSPAAWAAFSLAPAYLLILVAGQNGLIWLAGLLAALAVLRGGRWGLAGVLIGFLTLKPQFGLLIPVALMAGGLWRTTGIAALTALVVAALPTLATGTEFWPRLIELMSEHGERVVASIRSLGLMASPFSFFVGLGVPAGTALRLQVAVAIAAGLAVLVVWRSRHVSFDVKAATLLTGSLLASPYAWLYEAAMLAPVGLFLVRAGILERKPLHLLILAVLWLAAGLQTLAFFVGLGDLPFRWAYLVTPMMFLCLALCLLQVPWAKRPIADRR